MEDLPDPILKLSESRIPSEPSSTLGSEVKDMTEQFSAIMGDDSLKPCIFYLDEKIT